MQKGIEFPTEWVIVSLDDEDEQQNTPTVCQPLEENPTEVVPARAAAMTPSKAP